jgi:hypothetical protein
MKAGGMPNVDATADEMDALIAYLGTLGKPAADTRSADNAAPARTDISEDKSSVAKTTKLSSTPAKRGNS